ncbi:GlxA family transcriptional regulator [Colwelliaceae bacterium BS250]
MVKFAIVALDGCYGSSLHGLVDVLVVANAHIRKQSGEDKAFFSWQFFTSLNTQITTSNGLTMQHDLAEQSSEQFDVIFIPGVLYEGTKAFNKKLKAHAPLYNWLHQQHKNDAIICANCTATFFLAESGLLNAQTSTTVWWLERLYRKSYPQITLKFDQLLIEHDNLITAGAATSHFQLGLLLLKKFVAEIIVQQTAKTMLIDTRKVHLAPEQLLNVAREHNNKLVQNAQEWISQQLQHTFTIKELASTLATSERTLTRQFKEVLATTPLKYVQSLRINNAKYFLESSELSLENIIEKIGYKDRATFSKLFAKEVGMPPMSYRRQFQQG